MEKVIKILGIAGSLRQKSFNKAALRTAIDLAPSGATIEIAEIGDLPLYNADLEQDKIESVKRLKKQVEEADAILFVTPEYNYSIPGVLKNAIDWASRPYSHNSWEGKPAAIMGVTTGRLGTIRAQMALRQIFVFSNMLTINHPEVLVSNATEKFDENGKLIDEKTISKIKELLVVLVDWTKRLKGFESSKRSKVFCHKTSVIFSKKLP